MRLRWPTGFRCRRCGVEDEPWIKARVYLHCRHCGVKFRSRREPCLKALGSRCEIGSSSCGFVTSQKHGASALGLKRVLGLGSYQTAWTWLHKLRRAMVRPGRDRLSGAVEVDETFIGAPEEDVHGRETEDKAIVVVGAEQRGRAIGRIRLRRINDASAEQLEPFIQDSLLPGSLVITDGWRGYAGLEKLGYQHGVRNIRTSGRKSHELLPRVHRIASLLKRWLLGTFRGGVQKHHLDYYLDEFTFRFNRRASRSRGLLFYRLMQQAIMITPPSYRQLVGGADSADHKM
jgi:transposase-like protein